MKINIEDLARIIDHTNLKPDATEEDIKKLCNEAIKYKFGAVCVNPSYVELAAKILKDKDVKVCTVIGFPLGATISEVKAFEAQKSIELGASEIDMVINIGALKSGNYDLVKNDIKAVIESSKNALTKVILETCYLTEDEIKKACIIAKDSGANFVKTSTGFGSAGATIEHVRLMRSIVGNDMGVKASGGIRTYEFAEKLIIAGASRIGASSSIAIIEGFKEILSKNKFQEK
ncbi:MAG: deoxyribose-phosphate aldolase [Promethearchaeota archaeon]